MKRILIALCISVLLLGNFVGTANAFTVEATFYLDGVDLNLGDVYRDPTILLVSFGDPDEIQNLLKPPDNFFNFAPAVDFHFEFDPLSGIALAFDLEGNDLPEISGATVLQDTSFGQVETSMLAGISFDSSFNPLLFDDTDTIILQLADGEYLKLGILEQKGFTLQVGIDKMVPEPSTLLLFGLGLLGLIGFGRLKKDRKKGVKRTILLLLLVTIVGTAQVASAQIFVDSGQDIGSSQSHGMAMGDLNGNGFVDAFIANTGPNTVWLNNEDGTFSNSGQSLGDASSMEVALGDLDGNGSLDAFVANNGTNMIWLNDGNGNFSSGQSLGNLFSFSNGVELGDLDGNGTLDAFVANYLI